MKELVDRVGFELGPFGRQSLFQDYEIFLFERKENN